MSFPDPQFNAAGKRDAVRAMFAEIAPTYDRLNHLLTINIDKLWRRQTVRMLSEVLARPEAVILDLCCGTCDLTADLLEASHGAKVVGCDFCHPMLVAGAKKLRPDTILVEGDALKLPFGDAEFDGITIAFGLRNLENVEAGLSEMSRILKPGGRLVVLELSRPIVPLYREAFNFYFRKVLPWIGKLVSGSEIAYTYLPDSVRHFPPQRRLAAMIQEAGLENVGYTNLFLGVAAIHFGAKPLEHTT